MDHRFLKVPYKFVPPRRSDFWSYVASFLVPVQLRRSHSVTKWDLRNTERLRESIEAGKGVLIAPNHVHTADPPAMGMIGIDLKRYFYYAASWHLFAHGGLNSWIYQVTGGLSVFREGSDSEAVRECTRILAEGDRPLVLFPEGTYFWQNDRLGPLRDGLSLIVRQAVKKASRPVVVHPVVAKYWCLEDPRPFIESQLDAIERRLGWKGSPPRSLLDRFERLLMLYLASVEIEYLGEVRSGPTDERIDRFNDQLLTEMETRHGAVVRHEETIPRCQALRPRVVRTLLQATSPAEESPLWRDVEILWLCQQLHATRMEYVRECPSWERLVETYCRAEEDLKDSTRYPVPMGFVAQVGEAIDVGEHASRSKANRAANGARGEDPVMASLESSMHQMLATLIHEGPPEAWRPPHRPIDWVGRVDSGGISSDSPLPESALVQHDASG